MDVVPHMMDVGIKTASEAAIAPTCLAVETADDREDLIGLVRSCRRKARGGT